MYMWTELSHGCFDDGRDHKGKYRPTHIEEDRKGEYIYSRRGEEERKGI